MPICPVAAANGAAAVPKLPALHADGDFDDYPAYHSGKHTSAPTRPATAATRASPSDQLTSKEPHPWERQIQVAAAQPYIWVDVREDDGKGVLIDLIIGNLGALRADRAPRRRHEAREHLVLCDPRQGPRDGRQQAALVGGFTTEEEAKAARDESRVKARRGEYIDRNRVTVAAYLDDWIDSHAMEIKPRTLQDYQSCLRLYVTPHIGHLQVQAVRPSTITKLYRDLLTSGAATVSRSPSPP